MDPWDEHAALLLYTTGAGKEPIRQKAIPAPKVVDTTGERGERTPGHPRFLIYSVRPWCQGCGVMEVGTDATSPRQSQLHPANLLNLLPCAGAGDCFTAAYAVAVLDGKQGADALQFASAAACICVQVGVPDGS